MMVQVALKLIRHVREALPEIVSGQLLGLAAGETLEVTQCFPIASINSDDDLSEEEQQARAQADTIAMMTLLRTVNVDSSAVRYPFKPINTTTNHFSLVFSSVSLYLCPLRHCKAYSMKKWPIH